MAHHTLPLHHCRQLIQTPGPGSGLGTILLGQLRKSPLQNGVEVFEAEVVAANHAMLHVFRASGFPIEVSANAGQLHVVFPTSFTDEARQQFERRDSIASVNALKLFFERARLR